MSQKEKKTFPLPVDISPDSLVAKTLRKAPNHPLLIEIVNRVVEAYGDESGGCDTALDLLVSEIVSSFDPERDRSRQVDEALRLADAIVADIMRAVAPLREEE